MKFKYRWVLMPMGVIGVSLGYYLYFREKSRCASLSCAFVGRKQVSMRNRQAVVYFADGEVSGDRMIKAVRRVGFRASKKKRSVITRSYSTGSGT